MKTNSIFGLVLIGAISLAWVAAPNPAVVCSAVTCAQSNPQSVGAGRGSQQEGGQDSRQLTTMSIEDTEAAASAKMGIIIPCPVRTPHQTEGTLQSSPQAMSLGALPVYEIESTTIRKHDPRSETRSGVVHTVSQTGAICDGWGAVNVTIRRLISLAFNVNENQVYTTPGWANDDKFDMVINFGPATMDALQKLSPAPRIQATRGALLAFLTDRLRLAAGSQQRLVPAYAIVIGKGPKFEKVAASGSDGTASKISGDTSGFTATRDQMGGYVIIGKASHISALIEPLQKVLERPVADRTGLSGLYNFQLSFSPRPQVFSSMGQLNAAKLSIEAVYKESVAEALDKQMGLKLESSKVPQDVIVVDHVEKPRQE